MDRIAAIENDLTEARKHLTELQDDLPSYHALLTDNEQDALRLKVERSSLDAQAQARGRVQVAREMLEQHQSDIQNARAEVARLEAQKRREQVLAKIGEHAKRTTKHRRELEQAVHEGAEALGRALTTMAQAFSAIRDERTSFALLGRELAPEFDNRAGFNGSIQGEQKRAVCKALLSELEARGATLTDVLNTATGKHTSVDAETRPLPTPEYGDLLWQVFNDAVAKHPQQRHTYHGVFLPVKREPVQLMISTSRNDLPGGTMPSKRMRRRKPGTVADLSSTLWRAISHLEIHLDDTAKAEQVDVSELCKLSHALSQSAATYLKALEVGELEQRLEALEKAQAATQGNSYGRAA